MYLYRYKDSNIIENCKIQIFCTEQEFDVVRFKLHEEDDWYEISVGYGDHSENHFKENDNIKTNLLMEVEHEVMRNEIENKILEMFRWFRRCEMIHSIKYDDGEVLMCAEESFENTIVGVWDSNPLIEHPIVIQDKKIASEIIHNYKEDILQNFNDPKTFVTGDVDIKQFDKYDYPIIKTLSDLYNYKEVIYHYTNDETLPFHEILDSVHEYHDRIKLIVVDTNNFKRTIRNTILCLCKFYKIKIVVGIYNVNKIALNTVFNDSKVNGPVSVVSMKRHILGINKACVREYVQVDSKTPNFVDYVMEFNKDIFNRVIVIDHDFDYCYEVDHKCKYKNHMGEFDKLVQLIKSGIIKKPIIVNTPHMFLEQPLLSSGIFVTFNLNDLNNLLNVLMNNLIRNNIFRFRTTEQEKKELDNLGEEIEKLKL